MVGSVALLSLGAHDGGVRPPRGDQRGQVGPSVVTAVHHAALQGHRHPRVSRQPAPVKILKLQQMRISIKWEILEIIKVKR